MNETGANRYRVFLTVWLGQLISIIGSGLTAFAMGVWVYQQTGSATQFALMAVSAAVPGILMSPVAGALVDRWERRSAMILSDSGSALVILTAALLVFSHHLAVWHAYFLEAGLSFFAAFQWPAYSAAISLLVPKDQLGRAGGLVQSAQGGAQLIAPLLAGVLIGLIGLPGILLIDCITYVISIGTLVAVRFPEVRTAGVAASRPSLWREMAGGGAFIIQRPGLLALLVYFAAINFTLSFATVLIPPLVLSLYSPAALGVIGSVTGLGFLLGSVVMSAWGGPKHQVLGVLCFGLLSALMLVFLGAGAGSAIVVGTAGFVMTFGAPICNGCSQAIWQRKTEPAIQGRVFAFRRMVAWSSTPVAYLLAGPLADRVFEPLMAPHGSLASTVGNVIGVGKGHGIGLLLLVMGLLTAIASVIGLLTPRIMRLEAHLSDALPDDPSHTPIPRA